MMTKHLMIALAICFAIGTSAQVFAQNKPAGFRQISIRTNYSKNIPDSLKTRIDSLLNATIARLNDTGSEIKVNRDTTENDLFLTLKFEKVKLVTKRRRNFAYAIDGAGMIIAPLICVAAGMANHLSYSYFPKHKIKCVMVLSPKLSESPNGKFHLNARAGVLFANIDKKTHRLFEKFSDKLYQRLLGVRAEITNPSFSESTFKAESLKEQTNFN